MVVIILELDQINIEQAKAALHLEPQQSYGTEQQLTW